MYTKDVFKITVKKIKEINKIIDNSN